MPFPYKAVLFDWAYTLVDLVDEDGFSAFQELFRFLEGKGVSLPDLNAAFEFTDSLFKEFIRSSRVTHQEAHFETVLKTLLLRYPIDINGKTSLEEMLRVYYAAIHSCRRIYPDVLPALKQLLDRGVRMGIISNTTNPGFIKHNERLAIGLDPFFEFSIYSTEVPFRKPHPSIFRLAQSRLGLAPEDILFVGDHLQNDVEGAQAVGMRAAWLNRDGEENSNGIRPEYVLSDLTGLTEIQSRVLDRA